LGRIVKWERGIEKHAVRGTRKGKVKKLIGKHKREASHQAWVDRLPHSGGKVLRNEKGGGGGSRFFGMKNRTVRSGRNMLALAGSFPGRGCSNLKRGGGEERKGAI